MIDIDASLQAIEARQTFWVKFTDPGDEKETLSFEVKALPTEQRKLIDRNLKISTNYLTGEDQGKMQLSADWISLASYLVDYVVNWEGFVGAFNKDKLELWLSKYPSYGIAFAQSFKKILDEYERELIQRKDAELKN